MVVAPPRCESLRSRQGGLIVVFYQIYHELRSTLFYVFKKEKKKISTNVTNYKLHLNFRKVKM